MRLVGNPGIILSVSPPQQLPVQAAMPALYMGAGDQNPQYHASATSTLFTEQSANPQDKKIGVEYYVSKVYVHDRGCLP